MKRGRFIWAVPFSAVGAMALTAGCGGKIAAESVADAGVSDAATDGDYEGGWCSLRRGPLASGPAVYGDVSYCGYEEGMWRHCSFGAGSKNPNDPGGYWGCCYPTDTRCCPTAETSGTFPKGSCNGYGPGN